MQSLLASMKASSTKPSNPDAAVPVSRAPGERVKTAVLASVVAGVASLRRFWPALSSPATTVLMVIMPASVAPVANWLESKCRK